MTVDYLKDLEGERVRVHWNLHRKHYSIATYEKGRGWRVVRDKKGNQLYAGKIVLRDVNFKVSEAGRLRAIFEGVRNVHAWVEGELLWAMPVGSEPHVPCGYPIFYSLTKYDSPHFMFTVEGDLIYPVNKCRMVSMGMTDKSIPQMMGV